MSAQFTLHHGDCLEVLRGMDDNSVDSIVTDPPYGLSFMGKRWDYDVPSVEIWAECLRVLKPGGHLLAFAGTRTQHRMAVRIEDAGFEIRDMIAWVYGSGFPKSLDVSKAIDKAAGAEREFTPIGNAVKRMIPGADQYETGSWIKDNGREYQPGVSEPATDAARQWQGWGTALKPALEPITVARKPLVGTVAANVLQHGTGALNIDGCRVAGDPWKAHSATGLGSVKFFSEGETPVIDKVPHDAGRWPANLITDGSEEVLAGFPQSNSGQPSPSTRYGEGKGRGGNSVLGAGLNSATPNRAPIGDTGSAARFFKQVAHDDEDMATMQRFMYCAKASKRDRNEGLDGFEAKEAKSYEGGRIVSADHPETAKGGLSVRANIHPTVKPTNLMAYLCRLVTPPGGAVLDPFMGSGSTGKAAMREGFRFIGIEREAQYLEIARARINAAVLPIERDAA